MTQTALADGLSIEALHAGDAPRILAHFARLSRDDRALRFNSALTDDANLARYVSQMRFGTDLVFGLVDASGRVVGVAHGCVFDAGTERLVEAAFSIDATHRGRGFGNTLMRSLQAAARQCGARAIIGLCAPGNWPMRRVFERAGMQLMREEDEMQGRLDLQPDVEASTLMAG